MIPELNGDFLQWLRGFYYVAKSGSVRKAAELMHRNPSTISYQIRSLEEELGTVLFDRYKKSLVITPEGKKLLGWTISTFETLQSMRSAVGTSSGHLRGDVTVAATLPVAVLAAQPIGAFLRRHPEVHINIQRELSRDVLRVVKESSVDFGLLGLTSLPKLDTFEILLKARPLLVYHKDNHWNIPLFPTGEDLQRLPFVVFQHAEETNLYWHLHVSARKFAKNVLIRTNNYHLLMQYVRCGIGVGIVDELCYRATAFGTDWSNVVSCPLEHLFPVVLYGILVRRQKHISPQAAALMDMFRNHFTRLGSSPWSSSTVWPASGRSAGSADTDGSDRGEERTPKRRSRTKSEGAGTEP